MGARFLFLLYVEPSKDQVLFIFKSHWGDYLLILMFVLNYKIISLYSHFRKRYMFVKRMNP